MEQLRKVVAVGCLTYVLYGLISWFQLGVFLPPLPAKPFLFLVFAIFGLYFAIKSGVKTLDVFFYLWLVLISILNQSILELFISTSQIISFQDSVEIFFELISVILFTTFNSLIILSLRKIDHRFILYFLPLTALIFLIFISPSFIGLKEALIIMTGLYFLSIRFTSANLDKSLDRIIILLTGIALIEVIELLVLTN